MPIRTENKSRYPKYWKIISYCLRMDRAKGQCEWNDDGIRCEAHHMQFNERGSRVRLTTAHLDHTPENCHPDNLRVWCEQHHNAYDAPTRRANRKKRLDAANGVRKLL